jgi:hypothetical protein
MFDDLNVCKICNVTFTTQYAKNKHLKTHKISYKNYVIKFYYDGIHPVCKCGCGKIMPFRREPEKWFRDFAFNHAPKLYYTEEYIDAWKNKCQQTNIKKYGQLHYTNRKKAKKTSKCLYGNEYYNNRKKSTETRINSFLNGVAFKDKMKISNCSPEFDENEYSSTKLKYKFKCNICQNIFYDDITNGRLPRCLICHPHQKSNSETEIYQYLKSIYDGEILRGNKTVLDGKELDIYIPDKNIAIEFDGLMWHSEIFGKKDKNYHLNKTKECEKKGIRLIHIFEDEWINKKEIAKSRLLHILNLKKDKKIYARNCTTKEITSNLKNEFLLLNHMQGTDNSSISIGAFFENELVSVMTFGALRRALGNKTSPKNEYELMRFVTGKNVVGISSKLLSHFIKTYRPTKIVSYADRRWSIGNLYEQIGFKKISDGTPNYWYIDNRQHRYHRFGFRKNILHKKLKIFNIKLTEWQNMQLNGYDRIWDCGSLKYFKKHSVFNFGSIFICDSTIGYISVNWLYYLYNDLLID